MEKTGEAYYFERLSAEKLPALIELYKACFGVSVELEFLQKKYDTLAFGASFIGYLAYHQDSGEVAAYYGVFPMKANFEGKIATLAQSGDTMTHPRHQGKGLFTTLANKTYDLAAKEGIDFIFGFPNENSYPGFVRKLNWIHKTDINNYRIPTGGLPIDKLAVKIKIFKQFHEKWVNIKLKKYRSQKQFENSVSVLDKTRGYIIHDQQFYAYKQYYKHHLIQLGGIECVLKADGRLWIGDLNISNTEQLGQLIPEILRLAKKMGCSSIQFSVDERSQINAFLSAHYSVRTKNPVGYLNLSNKLNPEDFMYQAFDFDTY